jgi:MFS family permease
MGFRRGLVLGLAGYVVLFAVLVTVPFWFTGTGRGSAVQAAVLMTALPAGVAIAAPIGGHLAHAAARSTAVAGLLVAGFGAAALTARPHAAGLVVVLVLVGVGLGLLTPSNTTALMRPVAAPLAGSASGLINMTRGLGTALGTGLSALAVGAGRHPDRALVTVAAALCLASVAAATLGRSPAQRRGRMDR